jgi:predicted dehydrogenase
MGRWHAYYAPSAGADVVAVVDQNASAAAALQKKCLNASVFTELADCLIACPADVFHVCTPVESHGSVAEMILRAGKSALLEKPIATSALQTQSLLRLARSKNVKLMPVHQLPFQRGFQRLRQGRGDLGEPVRVSFNVCTAGGAGRTAAGCRTLLLEILPHPLSLFFALFEEKFARSSWNIVRFTSTDLNLTGNLDDVLLEIALSLRGLPTRNELTLVGTKRTGRVDFFHGYSFSEPGSVSRRSKMLLPFRAGVALLSAAGANLIHRALRAEFAYPGLRELIRQFYQSVRAGSATPISEDEILETASFIDRVSFAGSENISLRDAALPDRAPVSVG